jgi:hypothetical protein
MRSSGELAVQRLVLRTRRSPLRGLWRILYAATARAVAAWLARRGDTVCLAGSLANGEPVYGLSDIDLIGISSDRAGRAAMARRVEQMYRALPFLRVLVQHIWLYDQGELADVIANPYPTFGLDDGRAAFSGSEVVHDPMGLLERPGLDGPVADWRRLCGAWTVPAVGRERQELRLRAWLELQYRWKTSPVPDTIPPGVFNIRVASMVSAAARIWLRLATGRDVRGRRPPLQSAAALLPGEHGPLSEAVRLLEASEVRSAASTTELWSCFVRLSRRIAELIGEELATVSSTDVALDGDRSPDRLQLHDWRGLVLRPIDWSAPSMPTAPEETFTMVLGDPSDLATVQDAARSSGDRCWPTLRSGPLLVRPSGDIWGAGHMRGIEMPASDPVSVALAEGRECAAFPDVGGWSALDRARRAVAEHRAWLRQETAGTDGRPTWIVRPLSVWPTPATVSLLLSAAQCGLFLDSLQIGEPRLAITEEAAAAALGARDEEAEAASASALEALVAYRHDQSPPLAATVLRLRRAVNRLPAYAPPELVPWL